VAHSAAVNCLKIGRKSSRVLVTGGEDHKVNLWAIGKPNAILVSSRSTVSLCVGYKLVECFYGIHSFWVSHLCLFVVRACMGTQVELIQWRLMLRRS